MAELIRKIYPSSVLNRKKAYPYISRKLHRLKMLIRTIKSFVLVISLVKILLQLFEYITFPFFSPKGKMKTVQLNDEILSCDFPIPTLSVLNENQMMLIVHIVPSSYCAAVLNNNNEMSFYNPVV